MKILSTHSTFAVKIDTDVLDEHPLISPHPHKLGRNVLEEHPLVGQVDTK